MSVPEYSVLEILGSLTITSQSLRNRRKSSRHCQSMKQSAVSITAQDQDAVFCGRELLSKLEHHIDEIEHDASGAVTSARMSWVKAGNRKIKDWDNTILGTLRLDAGRLVAEVNSARRAAKLTREIAKRLGPTAVLTGTAVVDPAELIKKRPRYPVDGEGRSDPSPEAPEELRAMQEEVTRRHWQSWLDTRVPALGSKTPRQAARTAGGRERLEALLAEFERANADGPLSVAAPVTEIRLALGLTGQRR